MLEKIRKFMGLSKVTQSVTSNNLTKADIQFILNLISNAELTIQGKQIQQLYDVLFKLQELHKNTE